jgi:hypothetical protein
LTGFARAGQASKPTDDNDVHYGHNYGMRTYSTEAISKITVRLFRIQALLEQIEQECEGHRDTLELIRREMKAAVDALQPTT